MATISFSSPLLKKERHILVTFSGEPGVVSSNSGEVAERTPWETSLFWE